MHGVTFWRPSLSEKPWCGQIQGQERLSDPLSVPPVPLCGLSACMDLLLLLSVSSLLDLSAVSVSLAILIRNCWRGFVFLDTVLLKLIYRKFSSMLFGFPFSSSNLPKGKWK